jgi:hypothetical protein
MTGTVGASDRDYGLYFAWNNFVNPTKPTDSFWIDFTVLGDDLYRIDLSSSLIYNLCSA